MKAAFIALILMSTSVLAGNLPEKIICKSNALSSNVKSFEITELHTLEPDSSIFDSSFLNLTSDAGQVTVSFSNECDNWYEVKFRIQDLRDLKNGLIKEVAGELNYSDVDLSEIRNSTEPEEEKIQVICR